MPTTRRARTQESVFAKEVAKNYLKKTEKIRSVLKQKRKEYKEALAKEKKAKTQEELDVLKEKKATADAEFEAEKLTWPYYRKYEFSRRQLVNDGLDIVPYSPQAEPFPGDGALIKLSMMERGRIVDTAILARRGVKDKKRFLEGLIPRITSSDGIHDFKHYIRKYINPKPYTPPPNYPRGSSEYDDDEEYEQWHDPNLVEVRPPANPYVNTRAPTYGHRPSRAHVVPPEGAPRMAEEGEMVPAYSSSDYQLREGGNKTRKHKQSKHKRSKHKRSKHKRSKHKRTSKHKRSKTYKK